MSRGFALIAVIAIGFVALLAAGTFYSVRPLGPAAGTTVEEQQIPRDSSSRTGTSAAVPSAKVPESKPSQLPVRSDTSATKVPAPTSGAKTSTAYNPFADEPQRNAPPWGAREERKTYELLTDSERAKLPACTSAMLTRSPVPLERITAIEPRGSTSPPEHALPSSSTDTYIAVDTRGTTAEVPLYAPGDIWITVIQPRTGVTSDPEDDVIHYALCKDVFGIVDHVKSLSPEVKAIAVKYACPHGGTPGDERCPILVLEPIRAGTPLGTVGRLQGNFNFGTWDLRHVNRFVNAARYGARSLHSACPFDYYAEPVKSQLTALLQRDDKGCGTVEYDIAGTMQGEWFYGSGGNYRHGDWVNHLFLGYDNRFPNVAVISVGGVVSQPLKWMFAPAANGTKNAAFQGVKDEAVYCYENTGRGTYWNYEKGPTGRILLQLSGIDGLKVEYQQGTCDGAYAFVSPTMYRR